MCSYCGCMYVDGGYSKVVESVERDYGINGRFRTETEFPVKDKKKKRKRKPIKRKVRVK